MLDLTLTHGVMFVWSGITLTARMIYARRARVRKARPGAEKTSPAPMAILAIGAWCAIIGLFIIVPEQVMSQVLRSPVLWIGQTAGIIGLVFGFWLLVRSHQALGDFYDYKLFVKNGHRVIDVGPYSYVRHPMYTTYFIWIVSTGLLLPHYIFSVILLLAVVGFRRMARKEEQLLCQALGVPYRAYMKRASMFLPKW